MIKLIEKDADSFARRAEMYYKTRPELMKLVEELYRAYRESTPKHSRINSPQDATTQRLIRRTIPILIPQIREPPKTRILTRMSYRRWKTLKDLETKYTDLVENYSLIERKRESTIQKVEELNASLVLQNQEHVIFAKKNGKQLYAMRSEIQRLQEERRNKSKELEEELDKAFGSEINIFVLSKRVQDLEENNLFCPKVSFVC
ncbi:putative protein Networked (NET), actin-binding (NAB) [Helianthus anomalus]